MNYPFIHIILAILAMQKTFIERIDGRFNQVL